MFLSVLPFTIKGDQADKVPTSGISKGTWSELGLAQMGREAGSRGEPTPNAEATHSGVMGLETFLSFLERSSLSFLSPATPPPQPPPWHVWVEIRPLPWLMPIGCVQWDTSQPSKIMLTVITSLLSLKSTNTYQQNVCNTFQLWEKH